ncbi:hypothetical protein [uncultured Desulfuromusa sp.]|uniref:hypothetical protein n=1 Tax=uncultured Desulfuromusa sp. TaxID=219183 RepID=UPI0037485837
MKQEDDILLLKKILHGKTIRKKLLMKQLEIIIDTVAEIVKNTCNHRLNPIKEVLSGGYSYPINILAEVEKSTVEISSKIRPKLLFPGRKRINIESG